MYYCGLLFYECQRLVKARDQHKSNNYFQKNFILGLTLTLRDTLI